MQHNSRPKLVATGIAPLGIVAIGVVPMGVVAIGVVPMGVISLGAVGMGLISAAAEYGCCYRRDHDHGRRLERNRRDGALPTRNAPTIACTIKNT